MWNHPEVFEIEKLYTNDTHQVSNTYGIEATGRVIAAVSVYKRLSNPRVLRVSIVIISCGSIQRTLKTIEDFPRARIQFISLNP